MAEGTETRMSNDGSCSNCSDIKYHEGPCKPMSDQPKKQELPPIELTQEDDLKAIRNAGYEMGGNLAAELSCRERQLLSALSDNEAKDARIAELQRTVNAVAGGAAQGLMLHAKFNNAFSAGAQRVRRSVEGMLEEKLAVQVYPAHGSGFITFYGVPEVDALLARIREAIK